MFMAQLRVFLWASDMTLFLCLRLAIHKQMI